MNPAADITLPNTGRSWQGPGGGGTAPRGFAWRTFLWSLVFPARRHRISVTVSGLFLMMLAMGIGTAAYNTASNILFITLSLLLACLLLSGLMSWLNFMGVCWRLRPLGAWRAGHEALVTVEVQNQKKFLPTYGLWFDFTARANTAPNRPDEPEPSVRAVLAAFEKATIRGRLFLRERLEAGGGAALDWVHKPAQRGPAVIELAAVGSFFPFGFLRKNIGTGLRQTVLVWPAQVEYQWRGGAAAQGASQGRRTARAGAGEDLLALRRYAQGDSHRLIHWKASARLGHLMVRQFAAESLDGYVLHLAADADVWTRPEQFELLCSLAGTLAEDLFAAGRLHAVAVNDGAPRDTLRVRDVEAFLDELAVLQPIGGGVPLLREPATTAGEGTRPTKNFPRNLITFAPAGARGVTAYVDGVPTASA